MARALAMHEDHRAFLDALDAADRLHRITAPVDKDRELACVARWASEGSGGAAPRALLFENVVGHDHPVSVGAFGSMDLCARALELSADAMYPRWAEAIEHPIPPRRVERGVAQEIVDTGDAINLTTLPVPVWTPGRDTHPYISSGSIVTADPETGIGNVGVYRAQVQGPRELGMFFGSARQHGAMHLAKYRQRGEPMPVAVVIGGPPGFNLAAAAKTTYGVDEIATAGALAGAPVPVVRGVTVDLAVPARAEFVIEGTIDPDDRHPEGPFGEALGYMDEATTAPRVTVTAITRRSHPIFHGYVQQLPPSEGHLVWEIAALGSLWYYLRHQMRLDWLLDAAVMPGSGGLSGIALQVRRGASGAAERLAMIFTQMTFGQKQVVVVDDDIDIRDPTALQWAVSTRADPARDVRLVDDVETYLRDPAVLHRQQTDASATDQAPYASSIMVIDATLKSASPAVALPTAEHMRAVAARWSDFGLPPIDDRCRVWRMLGNAGTA